MGTGDKEGLTAAATCLHYHFRYITTMGASGPNRVLFPYAPEFIFTARLIDDEFILEHNDSPRLSKSKSSMGSRPSDGAGSTCLPA